MEGFDNDLYIKMLVGSNTVAILQMVLAIRWSRIARFSFFLLFVWASWMNWTVSQKNPESYLEYANLTWSNWYREVINGWFAQHIQLAVGVIAICQGMIALSMLSKGWIFKIGAAGAIVFLLAISPLGIGAGFPCTLIMASAVFILLNNHVSEPAWQK